MKKFIVAILVLFAFAGASQAHPVQFVRDVVSLPVRIARNVLAPQRQCTVQKVVVQEKVVVQKQVVEVQKIRVAAIAVPYVQVNEYEIRAAYVAPYGVPYSAVPQHPFADNSDLRRDMQRLTEAVQQLQQLQLQQLKRQ